MGIRLRKAYAARDTAALQKLLDELKQLPARIEKLYRAMRAQWEHENRPNGFDVQDIRFGALKQRIFAAIAKLSAFLEGTAPAVPELEAKLLDFMGHGGDFEQDPDQCEWRWRRCHRHSRKPGFGHACPVYRHRDGMRRDLRL